jgi:bifunctional polynucleotide phosphatase/kinase
LPKPAVVRTATLAAFVVGASSLIGAEPAARKPRPDLTLFPLMRRTVVRSYRPPATGPVRVAFFDADSTLRVSRSGAPSANDARDVWLLPMVAGKLRELARDGWLIAVVSNQGGVEKGFVTFTAANSGLRHTCRLLSMLGAPVHYYDFAEGYDGYRKPAVGMADMLAGVARRTLGRQVDWERSIMVGDSGYERKKDQDPQGRPGEDTSSADRLFAEAVRRKYATPEGFAWHHPRDFFGWIGYGVRNFHDLPAVKSFLAAHPEEDPGVNAP